MKTANQPTLTILIVEDHLPTLMAVQALVSAALPACRTLAAESGERALELCASDAPHVVVMDIVLPGMDGIEATRRIKSLLPDTRVVMHSSHDMQIYREGSAAAGASAFVTKNRTFTDLVPAIAGLLPPGFTGSGGGPVIPADDQNRRRPQDTEFTEKNKFSQDRFWCSSLCFICSFCD